jgi:hypothetical protein
MALFKTVANADGTSSQVQMSAQEETAIMAEWAAARVPQAITLLSLRKALRRAGRFNAFVSWVNAQNGEIKDTWETVQRLRRNGSFVLAAKTALSLTDAQVDAIFIAAADIENEA